MSDQITTWNDPPEEPKKETRHERSARSHDLVFQMWEAGIRDLEEIAAETSYSPQYVRSLLQKRGFEVRTVPTRTHEQVAAVAADYNAGMAIRELLRKHNMSNNTLYSVLDTAGVPIRRSSGVVQAGRKKFLDEAVRMYEEGLPIKEIISHTGISPAVLYQELSNRDIGTRRGTGKADTTVIAHAVQMYINGSKITDIEIDTGISLPVLYRALAERNISLRREGGFDKRLNEALAMYQNGSSVDQIQAKTGIRSTGLYRELKSRGFPLRVRTSKRAQGVDEELALSMYDQGATFPEIARTTKITLDGMKRALLTRGGKTRVGLPMREGKKNLETAVEGYNQGVDLGTLEIDTFMTKIQILAALREKGLAIRP